MLDALDIITHPSAYAMFCYIATLMAVVGIVAVICEPRKPIPAYVPAAYDDLA